MQTFLFLFLFLFSVSAFAQQDSITYKFWISFTDKNNSIYSKDNPEDFLSKRAIDRRIKQNIPINKKDLPINFWYVDSIKNLGFDVINKSRWFNGIMIAANDSSLVNNIDFLFVRSLYYFGKWINNKVSHKIDSKLETNFSKLDYGATFNQLHMLRGDLLHKNNLKGKEKVIAVLDAGFSKVNELDAFTLLFAEGRILGTWDFVKQEESVYEDHSHGMMVLSIMGGNNIGQIIGVSPEASFWLLRSEDVATENLIEEYNWLCAAEFADSVGADIINSSLGYTTFDNVNQNHTYSDMDGKTTPVSIAAKIATRKGMIIVNSAGNSGSSSWHYIGAPADTDSILSVGAVDEKRDFASFSSFGPSYDGRVKPTIVAQGRNTIVVTSDNGILTGNGTSFSSPLIAGMTACLWQAHPNRTNMEIIDAIIKSSSLQDSPNDSLGYGLPNYALADLLLTEPENQLKADVFAVVTNPITENSNLYVYAANENVMTIDIFDINGDRISKSSYDLIPKNNNKINLSFLRNYATGIYFLIIQIAGERFIEKVMVAD